MKPCVIIGAGEFSGEITTPARPYFLIAADGGYDYLRKLGIKPDLIIGDFDSCVFDEPPDGVEVIQVPREKDETDVELALGRAVELGYDCFYIYGALGGRLDHSVANISLLTRFSRLGYRVFLIGEKETVTAVTDGEIRFGATLSGIISVFAAGDKAQGVCIRGLKYGLENAVLYGDKPVGVSNEFIGREGLVKVKKGTVIVITRCPQHE